MSHPILYSSFDLKLFFTVLSWPQFNKGVHLAHADADAPEYWTICGLILRIKLAIERKEANGRPANRGSIFVSERFTNRWLKGAFRLDTVVSRFRSGLHQRFFNLSAAVHTSAPQCSVKRILCV